jgi:hypothetical protein
MLCNVANLETEKQNARMAHAGSQACPYIAAMMGRKTRCGTAYEAVSRERR